MSFDAWIIGAIINLLGSICINVGTNLIKYYHIHHTHIHTHTHSHTRARDGGYNHSKRSNTNHTHYDHHSSGGTGTNKSVHDPHNAQQYSLSSQPSASGSSIELLGMAATSSSTGHDTDSLKRQELHDIHLFDDINLSVHSGSITSNSTIQSLHHHGDNDSSCTTTTAPDGTAHAAEASPPLASSSTSTKPLTTNTTKNNKAPNCFTRILRRSSLDSSNNKKSDDVNYNPSPSVSERSLLVQLFTCLLLPFRCCLHSLYRSYHSTRSCCRATCWWLGFLLFAIGNITNFISFGFAAQSLLAALGSIQFISNVFCSMFILGHTLTHRVIYATFAIVVGNLLIVVFASHETQSLNVNDLWNLYFQTPYKIYMTILLFLTISLYVAYKEAKHTVREAEMNGKSISLWHTRLIPCAYASISAIIGTQSVLLAKSCSELLRSTIAGSNQFAHPFTYLILVAWIGSMVFWLYRMNTALRKFDGTFIIPVLQVVWTLFSIIGGGIYFQEFNAFTSLQIALFTLGVLIVIGGVYLLAPQAPTSHHHHTAGGGTGTSALHHHSHTSNTNNSSSKRNSAYRTRARTRSNAMAYTCNKKPLEVELAELEKAVASNKLSISSLTLSSSSLNRYASDYSNTNSNHCEHTTLLKRQTTSPNEKSSAGGTSSKSFEYSHSTSASTSPHVASYQPRSVIYQSRRLTSQSPKHAVFSIISSSSSHHPSLTHGHAQTHSPRTVHRHAQLRPIPEPLYDAVDGKDVPAENNNNSNETETDIYRKGTDSNLNCYDDINDTNNAQSLPETDTFVRDYIASLNNNNTAEAIATPDNGVSHDDVGVKQQKSDTDRRSIEHEYITLNFDPPFDPISHSHSSTLSSLSRAALLTLSPTKQPVAAPCNVQHRARGMSLGFSMPIIDLDDSGCDEQSDDADSERDSSNNNDNENEIAECDEEESTSVNPFIDDKEQQRVVNLV